MGVTLSQTAGLLLSYAKEQQKFLEPSSEVSRRNQFIRYKSQTQTEASQEEGAWLHIHLSRLSSSKASLCEGNWHPSEGDRQPMLATHAQSLSCIPGAGGIRSLDPGIGSSPGPVWSSEACLLHS